MRAVWNKADRSKGEDGEKRIEDGAFGPGDGDSKGGGLSRLKRSHTRNFYRKERKDRKEKGSN